VLLFTQGSGTQTIDFEQFAIRPGQIYFMIPGQLHFWTFSGDLDGYVVNFNENLFSAFISNPGYLEQFPFFRGIPADSVIEMEGDVLKEAIFFFEKIIEEVNKKDTFSLDMVCFGLISLFISIARNCPVPTIKQVADQKQTILFNFRKLVNQHFAGKKLPKDYAAMLFVTPSRLNSISKELLGKPAGEVIRERILLEAKRLLVNANLSIAEIASSLSFADSSYFSKFFKKYTGRTPEAFRTLYA